jgi:hypothetical protein
LQRSMCIRNSTSFAEIVLCKQYPFFPLHRSVQTTSYSDSQASAYSLVLRAHRPDLSASPNIRSFAYISLCKQYLIHQASAY